MLLGGASVAASAEEAPPPSPTSTVTPFAPAPTVAITVPSDGQFVPQNSATVSGSKSADSSVAVSVGGAAGCSTPASDRPLTSWSCTTVLPNGPDVIITATETLADSSTSTSTVSVDVLGPPNIISTPPQTSPGKASGTGHPDSRIRLTVNGQAQDCTALVAPNGQWLCTIAGGPGTYVVKAQQSHPGVGNQFSAASSAASLVVRPAPPRATPAPAIPVPPKPVLPPPAAKPSPQPTEEAAPIPAPAPTERADAQNIPWLEQPIFPGQGGNGPTVREALTNWGTPTGFGATLPSFRDILSSGNLVWAPVVALLLIGLIALPARLLITSLRTRVGLGRMRLTGRNRRVLSTEDPAPRSPWLLGLIPLAVTAGLITLADGLNGEVRYLRLLFAVGAGLMILNLAGVALTARLSAGALNVPSRLRFLPLLLLAAATATALSRLTGIEPPLVSGVLIGSGFALAVPVKPRALVNLAQVGTVLALAVLAWIGHSAVGPVEGFWASALSETLATVCLAGIGSALVLMLPLGPLPGRVVLEWSPTAWFAAMLAVGTLAAGILLGASQAAFSLLTTALIVAGFAAISVAIWAWAHYVNVSRA